MNTSTFFSFAESLGDPILIADATTGKHIWQSEMFTTLTDHFGQKEIDDLLHQARLQQLGQRLWTVRSGQTPPKKIMALNLQGWSGHMHICFWDWPQAQVMTVVFKEAKIKAAERRRSFLNLLDESPTICCGDFMAAFKLIAEVGAKTIYANWAGIWRLEKNRERLVNDIIFSLESGEFTRLSPISLGSYQTYLNLLETQRAVTVHDTHGDSLLPGLYEKPEYQQVRAMMDCPIKIGGQLVGVVSLEYCDLPHEWTDDEMAFGASLADFAAIAIKSALAAKAEKKVAELMAKIPDVLYRRAGDYPFYTIESLSHKCQDLLGYSPDELIGHGGAVSFLDLVHPEDVPTYHQAYGQALKTGAPFDLTYRLKHKDGGYRYIWDRGTVTEIRVHQPQWSVLEGVWTDCTSHFERLTRADAPKARPNESQGPEPTVRPAVAHLSSPPPNVNSLGPMLLEANLAGLGHQYAQSLKPESDGLSPTMNTMVDYSKLEAGLLTLAHDDFSLKEMLSGLKSEYDVCFKTKNISFSVFVPVDFPDQVNGDCGRLRQILNCLLSNALHFTQKGWVVLRCSNEYKNESGRLRPLLTFQVADTGQGLDENQKSLIGKPFYPQHSPGQTAGCGVGLGLAVCSRLTKMMEGTLDCETQLGRGSVFKIQVCLETALGRTTAKFAKVDGNYLLPDRQLRPEAALSPPARPSPSQTVKSPLTSSALTATVKDQPHTTH